MKKISFIIIIAMTIVSCTSNNKSESTLKSIEVNPTESKTILYSELFTDVEVMKLESDGYNYLSEITKVIVKNNKIYILCSDMQSITIYNDDGELMTVFNKYGDGDGEYSSMESFIVNDDESIEILDRNKLRVLKYDKDGTFLEEWKNNFLAWSVHKFNNDQYAFYVGSEILASAPSRLIMLSKKSNSITNHFLEISKQQARFLNFRDLTNFSEADDGLAFVYSFNDTVYNVTPGSVTPKYFVNFGKYQLSNSFLKKEFANSYEFMMACRKTNSAFRIMGFYESEKTIMFGFEFMGKFLHAYYNKSSNTSLVANKYLMDLVFDKQIIETGFDLIPKAIHKNELYTFIRASQFLKIMDSLKQSMSDENWVKYTQSNSNLIKIYKKTKTDDNPLILRMKLK